MRFLDAVSGIAPRWEIPHAIDEEEEELVRRFFGVAFLADYNPTFASHGVIGAETRNKGATISFAADIIRSFFIFAIDKAFSHLVLPFRTCAASGPHVCLSHQPLHLKFGKVSRLNHRCVLDLCFIWVDSRRR